MTPITNNGPSATSAKVSPKFDLLSGDDFSSPTPESSLAIVPVGEPPESVTPAATQQNALALVDMLYQNNMPNAPMPGQTPPEFQQSQSFPSHPSSLYPNGNTPNATPYESHTPFNQGSTSWNGHVPQQNPLQDHQSLPAAAYGK